MMKSPNVFLYRDILPPFSITVHSIAEEIEFEQNYINIYGKTLPEPRLTALYGDLPYTYSNTKRYPRPWNKTLSDIKHLVEEYSEHSFNSCLLNYYRDGSDSIGLHADDERELGDNPVIATLSIGDSRTMYLRCEQLEKKFELHHGDLFIMLGDTQKYWKHEIRKQKNKGPRVSLTFRKILAARD
jgi:alkylated DNA repair dioxygenase AlkB